MGYLICNKCGSYYELQKGESPKDFLDKCECRGELEYFSFPEEDANTKKIPLSAWVMFVIVLGFLGVFILLLSTVSSELSYISLILLMTGFIIGYVIASLTQSIKKAAIGIVLILMLFIAIILMYLSGMWGPITLETIYNLVPFFITVIGFSFGSIFQKREEIKSLKDFKKESAQTWHDLPYMKREKVIGDVVRDFRVDGLDEIISKIMNLEGSDLYKNLHDKFYMAQGKFEPGTKSFKEDVIIKEGYLQSPLQKIAFKNMRRTKIPPLVHFLKFFQMYNFLETAYAVNVPKKLNKQDYDNIYLSGLDQRIVMGLDKFDKYHNAPEVTAEFFIDLNNVKWADNQSKQLFKKLKLIMEYSKIPIFGFLNVMFNFAEMELIIFLAGCSAVNDGRNGITQDDMVKAYKTYFKLINTDITKYKAIDKNFEPEIKSTTGKINNSYLTCEKCNGYYKLQDGESPEDFDQCQCGGKLKYYEDINEFENTETDDENINING